ncbi:efflux RND transporter periplasmic adaptor subunit [Gayadomonas joobiniege]|uniref:efflux RND transporter periplasmic adaptor subunit n=1 Tax=Gayadomonas joobiniege TaxID=1234606 RepID=UPI00036CCBD5|nr:efflux RND transporter periplasmic adaptor subunit [Gayadomonas joobiniege]
MKTKLLTGWLVLSWLSLSACSQPENTHEKIIRSIAWQQVDTSPKQQIRRVPGTLKAVDSAPLSFQVGGKIEDIDVEVGDTVKPGQTLAELELSPYELALQAAEGELNKALASYREAQAEYKRFQQLLDKQLVSESQYDNAKAQAESAESSVSVARTQLKIARKDLTDATLKAPYAGRITERSAEPSQQVQSGQNILKIESLHGLEISILVPETLVGQIEYGQVFNFNASAYPDKKLQARVTEISSTASQANAFPVTLTLLEQFEPLKAGMSVEVELVYNLTDITQSSRGETVLIPVSSILTGKNNTAWVYIYQKDSHTLRKQQVSVTEVIGNYALIENGLTPGEIIATAGVSFLQHGQQVRLMEQKIQIYN